MNFTYGFPLYTMKETKQAFNYLKYLDENNSIIERSDQVEYELLSSELLDRDKRLVILANSKKVQNIIVDRILPELSVILSAAGQKHGIVSFSSNAILSNLNPFVAFSHISNELYQKIICYLHEENMSMSAIWIYFDGFINKELEQIIKLKYNAFMLEGIDDKVYIKISPDENFSLIFDFVDDIMYHC